MGRLSRCCEALVLRYTDYGEADRILSLLTAEYGLHKGFARSARKSRKRFGAAIDPFTIAVFHWQEGRGELWMLQSAELVDAHFGLRRDIKRLALASYGVELAELLLREGEPQPQVYTLMRSFLAGLGRDGDLQTARLLLELRLIFLLGYMPHLLHCSACDKSFDQESVAFDIMRGGSLCPDCRRADDERYSLATMGSLARTLKVPYDHFDGFRYSPKTCREARGIFDQILRMILPREPKSLKFLDRL